NLSDLRDYAPHYESHPARGSSGCRRHHVGRRVCLFSHSGRPHYYKAPQYSESASLKSAGRPFAACSIYLNAVGQAETIEASESGFASTSIPGPNLRLATLSALRSTGNVPIGGPSNSRWPAGAQIGAHEFSRRSTLDTLAWADRVRPINSRKHFL